MTVTTAPRTKRPNVAARRTGYAISVVVNAMVLFAANVWPGWEAVPFLTADTALVMGLVNASIIVSLVVNVVYLIHDPRWVRALGDLLTTSVGLAAMVRIWQVSPFDFGESDVWMNVVQVLLFVGIAGSIIGIIAALVSLVRSGRDAPG